MKRFARSMFGLWVAAALLLPGFVWAESQYYKEKKKAFIKVESVDATANKITITDTNGTNKEYTVDSFTTISINGKPGKLADVSSGMKADVTASFTKISRLEVTDPPEDKTDKKKKKY